MVITTMSTTEDSDTGDSKQAQDELTKVKEKLKVQQRLIDISARNLQSTRLSSRSNLHSPTNGGGESLIEGNLREKEVV